MVFTLNYYVGTCMDQVSGSSQVSMFSYRRIAMSGPVIARALALSFSMNCYFWQIP